MRCRGSVQALKTSSRGASKTRVKMSSRSAVSDAALACALLTGMLLLLFEFLAQVGVQTIKTLFPEIAVVFHPVRDIFEWTGLETAGPPLGFASARDQSCALEHLEVFADCGEAHLKRFRQLVDRSFA